MQVAILSDTHVPSRAPAVPEWVLDEVRAADHTIHAGDFDSSEAFGAVRDAAGDRLTVVAGNMDPHALDLPRVATVECDGVTFVVTHGTGDPENYESRVAATVREAATDADAVGVSGHTHQVMDGVVDGVRLLNPGSATGAAPATEATMFVATVDGGELSVERLRG